jgi:hypothetical protein
MVRHARTLLLAVMGFSVMAGAGAFTGVAHADPPNSVLDTVQHCKSKIPNNLEDKVCTEKNMKRIRDVVQDRCSKAKDNAACVEKAAEQIVNNIANKDPQNKNDFDNALEEQIKGAVTGECDGVTCPATPTGAGKNCDDSQCNLIALYVNPAIKLMSIVVLLIVTASLVYAGVQYSASSGDAQKTGAAKTRITNTLLAFLAYVFMLAFLNFLIPGGLFT